MYYMSALRASFARQKFFHGRSTFCLHCACRCITFIGMNKTRCAAAILCCLSTLLLGESATIAGTTVRRTSLLGYEVGGERVELSAVTDKLCAIRRALKLAGKRLAARGIHGVFCVRTLVCGPVGGLTEYEISFDGAESNRWGSSDIALMELLTALRSCDTRAHRTMFGVAVPL